MKRDKSACEYPVIHRPRFGTRYLSPGIFSIRLIPLNAAKPVVPGVNAENAGSSEALDPNFRPSMSHQYDLTVQRQINAKTTIEFGYIGRHYTHDLQSININAVPYMMTLGGQTFAKAFGQMAWQYCAGASFPNNQQNLAGGNCVGNLAAVTDQPDFKASLNPAY